jgi:hypothetical protein
VSTRPDLGSVLEADLKARRAALQTLTLSPSLAAGDLTAFGSQLQQMMSTQFPASNILLWNATGQQIMNTVVPPSMPMPARDPPPNLRQIFAIRHPGISNAYADSGLGRAVVAVDVPVQREDGTVVYALSMTPAPNMVTDQLHSMPVGEDWTIAVADRMGIILARSKDGPNYVGRRAGPAFFSHASGGGPNVAETVNRQGTPVLMTFSQSEPSGWTVAIGIPQKDLTAPAWHLAFLTLIAGGALLLLGLAMARGVARCIIGPIDALRMLSATGNRGAPSVAFATGLREVDEVGRALVASITELEESRTELARVNTGIESRVIEALAASEAAYERLAQGQKIQALGQLAGGIAHDFNKIQQTVSGAAAMIERRSEDGERVKRLARVTLEVAARGASITQRLLSFASWQTERGTDCDHHTDGRDG